MQMYYFIFKEVVIREPTKFVISRYLRKQQIQFVPTKKRRGHEKAWNQQQAGSGEGKRAPKTEKGRKIWQPEAQGEKETVRFSWQHAVPVPSRATPWCLQLAGGAQKSYPSPEIDIWPPCTYKY